MTYQETLNLETGHHGQMQNITADVSVVIQKSGIQTGTAHVFNVGSTATVGTIEFEPGLEGDFPAMLDRLIPPSHDYGHERAWNDGNGHSHLQATLMGPSLTMPIAEGKPLLGTWQQIMHLECDIKPRHRKIVVTVTGD